MGNQFIIVSLGLAALNYMVVILFDLLGEKIPIFGVGATFFYDMQRLPVFLISVTLFIGFLGLPIKYNRLINAIASATFGVYLIHDDNLVRPFLWETLFKDVSYADSNLLIPYSIAVIVLVFVVCTLIELFRIYVIEKHYMKSVDDLADKIENRINKFFETNIFKKI